MNISKAELVAYLNNYLQIATIKDYGPQGLQVEAETEQIGRIALAVDVSPAIINAAAEWQADMLLVHHGIFWGGPALLAGAVGKRVRLFLKHDMHLYAAHLPLDAHAEVGNNAVLAQMVGLTVEGWWCAPKGTPLGVYGRLPTPTPIETFTKQVNDTLNTTSRLLQHGPSNVSSIAILSGFGADKAAEAKALGADTLLTGETSHANYWAASDLDLNIIYAGHYATETVGVKALGNHLSQKYSLVTKFFDFPTFM